MLHLMTKRVSDVTADRFPFEKKCRPHGSLPSPEPPGDVSPSRRPPWGSTELFVCHHPRFSI